MANREDPREPELMSKFWKFGLMLVAWGIVAYLGNFPDWAKFGGGLVIGIWWLRESSKITFRPRSDRKP